MSQPIFILGAHKSGTSLLRSIFDGHSQIFTVPFESHFFQIMHYWVDNEYRKQRPKNLNKEQMIQNFCDWIHHCNTAEDLLADSVAKGLFNEDAFQKKISEIEPGNDSEIFNKYFQAIYYSLYGQELPPDKRIVEKSVENAEFAAELSSMYPDAKFIHILRNPYANIVALRKYKSVNYGFPLMNRILSTLYNNFYFLYKNKRIIKNYKVIRYSDLVTQPEAVIQDLCKFVNIPFDKIMLTPTSLGKQWQGNSTSGKQFSGISSSNLNRWKDEIHPIETYYVNKMFSFVLRDFGYKKIEQSGSFWKKAKGENLTRYIINRLYKFYIS